MTANGAHRLCHHRCSMMPNMKGTKMRSKGTLANIDEDIVRVFRKK